MIKKPFTNSVYGEKFSPKAIVADGCPELSRHAHENQTTSQSSIKTPPKLRGSTPEAPHLIAEDKTTHKTRIVQTFEQIICQVNQQRTRV
jgi:hypothetical protein